MASTWCTRGRVVFGAFALDDPLPGLIDLPVTAWRALVKRLTPRAGFPLARGHNVQFFVRARKAGEDLLAGVSTRRLVQVRTAR